MVEIEFEVLSDCVIEKGDCAGEVFSFGAIAEIRAEF